MFSYRLSKFAVCIVLLAPALASCGGSHGAGSAVLPSAIHQTGGTAPLAIVNADESATVQARFEAESAAPALTCNRFPLICVDQGSSASIGIKVTCTRNGHVISCGTVHWTVRTSHAGLTASIKPNPGNPVKDTVHASTTVPAGTGYTQTISTTCSLVRNCPRGTFPIHVTP